MLCFHLWFSLFALKLESFPREQWSLKLTESLQVQTKFSPDTKQTSTTYTLADWCVRAMMTSRWHGSATSPAQCKWAFISEWQDKTGVLRQGDTSSSVPAESLHRWTGGDAFQLSSFSMNSSAILVSTSCHLENRCADALYALASPHSDSLETALDCTAHYYTNLCDVCVQSKAFSSSFFWRDVGDRSVKASDRCHCVKMCACLPALPGTDGDSVQQPGLSSKLQPCSALSQAVLHSCVRPP